MNTKNIHEKIYEIRGQKVMLDFDLAQLYEVETRVFNQAVKRNGNGFPEDFMFRLTTEEWEDHKENWSSSQIVMTSQKTQLQEIRDRLGEHDVQLNCIYDAIENLLDEKANEKKWEERPRIGFKR